MATYNQSLTDTYTGETVVIKSNDYLSFESKKQSKLILWEKRYKQTLVKQEKETGLRTAQQRTTQAEKEFADYNNILNYTLKVDDKIDWEKIKDSMPFKSFVALEQPSKETFFKNVQKPGLKDLIPYFKKQRLDAETLAASNFNLAFKKYSDDEVVRKQKFENEKSEYEKKQNEFNQSINDLKIQYESKDQNGVKKYIDLVLEKSYYPEKLKSNLFSEVCFDSNQSTLVIDVDLPLPDQMPKVKEYKYVLAKKTIEEKLFPKQILEDLFNNVIYQIVLRSIHEVIESDYCGYIETVVFNGWLEEANKATGKVERKCLLSVQVPRTAFLEVDLSAVNPKDCFAHFKGVTAGNLMKLSPVRPLMRLNMEDGRIIQADNIIDTISEEKNLAVMDWQEFEVLVRDIISKEFSHEGCRVEVTQASRDQGVDALAFDEDPIRGGKYVIQAKRYNNLVGLSAVRDLYGTVVNEGAVKGILITTSYYGKESLDFAKDKPLKLINGEELLYMFTKHGYNFKIELQNKKAAVTKNSY